MTNMLQHIGLWILFISWNASVGHTTSCSSIIKLYGEPELVDQCKIEHHRIYIPGDTGTRVQVKPIEEGHFIKMTLSSWIPHMDATAPDEIKEPGLYVRPYEPPAWVWDPEVPHSVIRTRTSLSFPAGYSAYVIIYNPITPEEKSGVSWCDLVSELPKGAELLFHTRQIDHLKHELHFCFQTLKGARVGLGFEKSK